MTKKTIKTKNAYQESSGRYVYKTQESYKGVEWTCRGTSMENVTQPIVEKSEDKPTE